jgi:hypothetical protein
MARTYAETEAHVQAQSPAPSPVAAFVDETPSHTTKAAAVQRAQKAYELTDKHGNRAYVWWDDDTPTVDADDPALRRRVQRALKKPIWSREDELDEFGLHCHRLVLIQPDDPRYRSRLLWRWDQLKIRDLASVDVVTLPDRQSVRRFSPLDRAVTQRLRDVGMPTSASTDWA